MARKGERFTKDTVYAPTREEAINKYVDKSQAASEVVSDKKGTDFIIWRKDGKFSVGKKLGQNYASLKSFDTVQEARA